MPALRLCMKAILEGLKQYNMGKVIVIPTQYSIYDSVFMS
jgi:hypothetical protein